MPPERDLATLLAGLGTKVRDIEERTNLLRDRILTVSKTMLSHESKHVKEVTALKSELRDIRNLLDRLRETVARIASEIGNFARREEVQTLERYLKLWEPLKFVKEADVRKIVREELRK